MMESYLYKGRNTALTYWHSKSCSLERFQFLFVIVKDPAKSFCFKGLFQCGVRGWAVGGRHSFVDCSVSQLCYLCEPGWDGKDERKMP